jgi:hypothetical protein
MYILEKKSASVFQNVILCSLMDRYQHFSSPKYEVNRFLGNIGSYVPNYMPLHPEDHNVNSFQSTNQLDHLMVHLLKLPQPNKLTYCYPTDTLFLSIDVM